MAHARSVTRRSLVLLCTAAVTASSLVALPSPATAAATAPGHDRVVSAVPKQDTPNVQDESVDSILDAGDKIIAAGEFTDFGFQGTGAGNGMTLTCSAS